MSLAPLVVLGSGPAGLTAAWRARLRGHPVTVLEQADRVGGLAGSFDVAGVRVDHGSHRLHPATPPALLADLRALLGGDLQTRRRNGRLRVGGTWVGFPLRAGQLIRELPTSMLARVAVDAVGTPLRRRGRDSFAGVLRAGMGPTLYDALYAPYAVKLWGLSGEQISADQATRRVTADSPWKVAGRMLRLNAASRQGQGRIFHYPRRGFGQLVDAVAAAAVDAGVDVRLRTRVTGVALENGGVRVDVDSGSAVTATHVFSTLPLPVLARLTEPGAPESAVAAASQLSFRAMVLVYVVHAGGRWTAYDAHYLPGPETPVTRISEPANYRASPDDPVDRSVLCVEIPCAVEDDIWTASDEQLAAIVDDALAATGLPPMRRTEVVVRRLPHVYPVYARGYERQLAALQDWTDGLSRVTTFGRLGLFAHDNTHHALAMAYDAVAALRADGSRDERAWSEARARFATHVVED